MEKDRAVTTLQTIVTSGVEQVRYWNGAALKAERLRLISPRYSGARALSRLRTI
jgi:hypothetical protein